MRCGTANLALPNSWIYIERSVAALRICYANSGFWGALRRCEFALLNSWDLRRCAAALQICCCQFVFGELLRCCAFALHKFAAGRLSGGSPQAPCLCVFSSPLWVLKKCCGTAAGNRQKSEPAPAHEQPCCTETSTRLFPGESPVRAGRSSPFSPVFSPAGAGFQIQIFYRKEERSDYHERTVFPDR